MSHSRVTSWPTYLLTGVPEKTRSRLAEDAQNWNISVAEEIRTILCAHYQLKCGPVVYRVTISTNLGTGEVAFLLRLQPKLMRALRDASAETGQPVRTLILDALQEHYAAVA